jgi:Cu(I)/Ag(I) efflux system membrane fusion protein
MDRNLEVIAGGAMIRLKYFVINQNFFYFYFVKLLFMWKILIFVALITAFIACDELISKNRTKDFEPSNNAQSNNTDTVNEELGGVIDNYFSLKDNFIMENDAAITKFANAMQQAADTLDLNTVKTTDADKTKDKELVEGIIVDLKALVGEKNLEERRKYFQSISDKMYDLIKAIRYDKQIIYHDHCAMAFNEAGADWLSNTTDIKNPYIPKKMVDCGEVKDTIDFTKP